MFSFRKIFFFTLFGVVFSKTIRSRILTNENGTRELVFTENSGLKQEEIDFLLKNLNITTEVSTKVSREVFQETSPPPALEKPGNETETELSESILMNHWNALTEVGWRNFNNPDGKTLINNTRVLKIEDDENGKEVERDENGQEDENSLNENETEVKTAKRKPRDDTEKPSATISDLCEAIIDLCQIVQPQANREDLVRCLTLKNETLLHWVERKLSEEGESFECAARGMSLGDDVLPEGRREDETETETETETISTLEDGEESNSTSRSILRPRRLLHTVLLPLLALLVIKYLVTLPFVAMSVFTMNAMWLGLLSIGAVALAKLKGQDRIFHKFPSRRYNHMHGGEVFESGEPLPTSEIYWSPFRVPIMQSSVNAQ